MPPAAGDKPAKANPHALQQGFLNRLVGKPCTLYTVNGIRLTGKLRQFDQFTLLIAGMDGVESLVFKSAVSSITSGMAKPKPAA